MCGLIGLAGKLAYSDETIMKRLLMYDYFRGTDSTGFAALRDFSRDVFTVKIASHPLDLFEMKKFTLACTGSSSSVFLGHNRAATRGVVNNANAHPFTCDHITGAHNGTLTAASYAALEDAIGEKTGTDSEAIIIAIARLGIEETVKLLQGAWALVWFDVKDNSVNFLRNKERPFWYAYSDKFDKVLWSSEYEFIQLALKGQTVTSLFKDDKGYSFYATEVDWHYRFDLAELRKGNTERPKPKVKELKGKEPAPAPASTSNFPVPYRGGTSTHTGGSGTGSETIHSTTHRHGSNSNSDFKIPERITSDYDPEDPCAGAMTKLGLEFLAKYGCSWCHSGIDTEQPGLTIFPNEQRILCPKCTHSDSNRIYLPAYEVAQLVDADSGKKAA